jgi:pimeloyl-ACP methyl ester carboxylesterase
LTRIEEEEGHMPYAEGDGARIFWEEEGDGDPVLLIMGLGYPSAMWYRMLPYLVDGYRTIRFDNRGTGGTGVPAGTYTIKEMADDAAAVLDAAGEPSAHVVGLSMGGFIAQELALRHAGRVRSLALVCTHMNGPEAVAPSPEALDMMARRSSMTPREAAEAAVPFVYATDTDRALIEEDFAVRMRQPTSPEGYERQLQAVLAHGGTYGRLPQIGVPTLVVQGTEDRLVDPANAPVLAGAIPGAQLVMIEGASHVLLTDRTQQTATALRAFLDDVAR